MGYKTIYLKYFVKCLYRYLVKLSDFRYDWSMLKVIKSHPITGTDFQLTSENAGIKTIDQHY
jgi:hypothetical protein